MFVLRVKRYLNYMYSGVVVSPPVFGTHAYVYVFVDGPIN